jgi:aryl-alcohol dehydrogenase-like predicted oxidoreductase
METRRLGRTGHLSSVAIFGGAALWEVTQAEAEAAMDLVRKHGVNHVDVAPSYGEAEVRLGPWMAEHRDEVFLACKTMERTREAAWDELHRSLTRLQVTSFDLYQLHAVRTIEELDEVTRPGGALEAVTRARQEGLVRFVGITGHGYHAPEAHAAALERFDFDTVMTPLNFVQYADPGFRLAFERLARMAAERDVGLMVIKALTKGPWGDRPHTYQTWYEPFDSADPIASSVGFVLSQPVTAFASPGDLRLLPLALEAAARFRPMPKEEQAALIASADAYAPLFVPG